MSLTRLAFVALLLSTFGCSESSKTIEAEQKESADYLLFGHFCVNCVGETCIEIYKLTDRKLYEDSVDHYPGGDKSYPGKYMRLDDSLFRKVSSIQSGLPAQLITSPDGPFGMPDASDGGGIYIERFVGGKLQIWTIDLERPRNPEWINPFVDSVEAAVNVLSEW